MKDKYKKLLICVILLIILVLFTFLIKKYFKPFFIILFICIISTPLNNLLTKVSLFKENEKISILVSIFIINILTAISFYYMGNLIYEYVNKYIVKNYILINEMLSDIFHRFNLNIDTFSNNEYNFLKVLNKDFLKRGAEYTFDGVVSYFVGNIAAYFILVDKYGIFKFIEYFIPERYIDMFLNKLVILKNMMVIEIILILSTTLQTIIGFTLLRINNPFTLGMLCGILDLLPFVGTILVFIPLVAYNIIVKNYIAAGLLVALYAFIQINRQILETKLISNKLSLHPLLVLVSVYIAVKIFGLIGIFTGPLYVILAKEIILAN